MGIPLDIEDILGAGCLISIGRALSSLSCLWLGSATGIVAVEAGVLSVELLTGGGMPPDLMDYLVGVLIRCALGPLVLILSYTVLLFFPLLLAVYFTMARGDNGSLTKWLVYAGITGFLAVLSLTSQFDLDARSIGLSMAFWLVAMISLTAGAFFLTAWQRRRMVQHLIGVAAENDQRRRELAEEFGTAVGDREFATGQLYVVPPHGDRGSGASRASQEASQRGPGRGKLIPRLLDSS